MTLSSIEVFVRSAWVVWLIVLFVIMIFWALRPANRKRFEEDAQIPFKDKERD